jgi:hypothetical protein
MTLVAPGETRVDGEPPRTDETPRAPKADGIRELEERLTVQVSQLKALEPNWDGYGAKEVDDAALRLAFSIVMTTSSQGLPAPEIFPVPTGGVQLEWCAGPMELEFEIEPGGAGVVFVGDDRQTGERFDGQLPEGQVQLQQAIARLAAYR